MLDKNIIEKTLKTAKNNGIDFAEIFCEKKETASISFENNKTEKIRSGIDAGCGFRIINNNTTYYGYTNSFEEKEILSLAKKVIEAAKTKNKSASIKQTAKEISYQKEYTDWPLKKQIKLLKECNAAGKSTDKRIKQIALGCASSSAEILIANTAGVNVSEKRVRTRFIAQVIATNKKITETGYESIAAAAGFELFDGAEPLLAVKTAAQRALLNLEARPAPAGKTTVVLAGEAGGTMVHEACGHALEADFIQKKISIFNKKMLGQQIVSPLITVVDDGSLPGYYGTNFVDDEGTTTRKNILIEHGILKGFMSDLKNARLLKISPSGNGRRESYRQTPLPRMTNTYIAAGQNTYQEIVASVKEGLLVKKMGGGQVDITNGNFVFEITEGYLIKNGRVTEPVRGATLVGNGLEVLKNIDLVGNDLHFIPGTCGKGQAAPVTDGQPTLRIPSIIVGGHGQ